MQKITKHIASSLGMVLILAISNSASAATSCIGSAWYKEFGYTGSTYEETPNRRKALEKDWRETTGGITSFIVGDLDSTRGRENRTVFNHRLNRSLPRYGTLIKAQAFITLDNGITLGLRMKNNDDCAQVSQAQLTTLHKAFINGSRVNVKYMTIKNFDYVFDADSDGYVDHTHDQKNGLIKEIEVLPQQ